MVTAFQAVPPASVEKDKHNRYSEMADNNNRFSDRITVFRGRRLPENARCLAGYGAILHAFQLQAPPPSHLAVISNRHHQYEDDNWRVFTPRHQPGDTLADQLTFSFRYEGIDLCILKALFQNIAEEKIEKIITSKPTGRYSRRLWFLYEWLMSERLDLPDATSGNYVDLLDEKLQFTGPRRPSRRHRVRNNLPGTPAFCPLVRRTPKLSNYIDLDLHKAVGEVVGSVHPDVLARASSFLLLNDSRASFAIEGERPNRSRAERWGHAIGQAGKNPLSMEELLRLQQIIISDHRFTHMGWRREGGFVGIHDRDSGMPLPDHISADWSEIEHLIEGVLETEALLQNSDLDPVIAAAIIAFGFVFIHPFVDGNGRIHRYLIHHVLSSHGFTPPGIVFPISAVILDRIDRYRDVLQEYSKTPLEYIDWRPTEDGNVEVLNETADLYRYFDATPQAEFLYECVKQTIEVKLQQEILFLDRFDRMKRFIDDYIDMPDKKTDLIIRFLRQNDGKLSRRARTGEFKKLTDDECEILERKFSEIFHADH